MQLGDLVVVKSVLDRPLFASWRFESSSDARLVCWVKNESLIIVLSKSIKNPFHAHRLRKVLTPFGVGYMWESELQYDANIGLQENEDGNSF
jgi:hypothetical protein